MPDAFDPYHKWLAIPPEDQPPDHYRLLAVKRFESDRDVIANAADQRMVHVRSFQAGEHSAASQKLLNEIAAARVCLLDPKKKAAYDERLRAQEAPAFPELVTSAPTAQASGVRTGHVRHKPFYQQTPWQVALGAGAVGLVIVVVLIVANRPGQPDRVAREDASSPQTSTQSQAAPRDRGAPKPPLLARPGKGEGAKPQAAGAKPEPVVPKPAAPPDEPEPKPETPKPEPEIPKPEPQTPPEPVVPAEPKKAPLPGAEALGKAEQMFQEVFGEQVAGARLPAQKGALAEKILAQVAGNEDRSAETLVALRHAAELAAEAGRCDRTIEAIDLQARRFEVDPLRAKAEALARAVDAPKDAQPEVVNRCLALLDEALAAEDMETAGRLASAALASARKARDSELLKTAAARRKEVEALVQAFDAAEGARKTLADRPDDPAANATWGKYLVAMQHDWAAGLKHLAKADEAALARAAADDLAAPSDAAAQAALGDAWHKLAQGGGPMREPSMARAAWWYEKAAPHLEGLEQVRVEKRLGSIKVSEAHRIPPDIGIADPDSVEVGEVRSYAIPGPVCDIAVSRDGRTAMAGGWGHQVGFWDVPSGKALGRLKYEQVIYGVAISPDGRFAVCGGRDPVLHVIDFKTKREVKSPSVGHWQFKPVFLKDGKHFLIGTMSGAWLWDVESDAEGRKFGETQAWVQDLVVSRDERFLLTGSPDHTARLFDMATGKETVRLSVEGKESHIRVVALSPDGRKALAGGDDKVLHVWDLKTQREILRLKHEGAMYGLDVSANGRYILTGDGANVRLWSLGGGEELWKWPAPRVGPMIFLPDNRFALIGGAHKVYLLRLPIDKRGRIFEGPTERKTPEPAASTKPHTT